MKFPPKPHHVTQASPIPLETELRFSIAPGMVADRDLGDAVSTRRGEDRNETMVIALEVKSPGDFGAHGLETTVDVLQPQPKKTRGEPVVDFGGPALVPGILPIRLPSTNQVEALIQCRQESRDFRRIVCRSLSIVTTTSPTARANPAASAAVLPRFAGKCTTSTPGFEAAASSHRAPDWSVLPSSTRTIRHSWGATELRTARINGFTVSSSLKTGITTLTFFVTVKGM